MKTSDLVWQDSQHQQMLALIEELKKSPETAIRSSKGWRSTLSTTSV